MNISIAKTKTFLRKAKIVLTTIFLVVVVSLPVIIDNSFVLHMLTLTLIYVLLTIGQNLITGYTGMLSMGQAAFYGIGAYASAILSLKLGMPWPICFLIAGVTAGLFGVLVGFPCVKLGSDYLTLMTIGFSVIVQLIFLNWMEATNGPMGLRGLTPPSIGPFEFSSPEQYYYLYLAITIIAYVLINQFINSKYGRALISIRDDEIAAGAVGVNIAYYKVLAFGLGSFLAGIAGSMLAHFIMFVGPTSFSLDESILHMQMNILGGLGSMPGSILGAAIMTIIPQLLQPIYEYRMLISGVLMVALMVWRPQGLLGTRTAGKSLLENMYSSLSTLMGSRKKTHIE